MTTKETTMKTTADFRPMIPVPGAEARCADRAARRIAPTVYRCPECGHERLRNYCCNHCGANH